jgi:two-component system, cell cycle response regulator
MILDIDHFKAVNDTHGHDAGDEILKGFSARIRKTVRTADLVCRAARSSWWSCPTRR